MKKNFNKQVILAVLLVALLIAMLGGVTYAFFNYTRTGVANTLQVGRIAFNSTQNNTIRLENVFPTSSANLNSSNSDTVTITITGDTTYSEGIEYKVTLEDVNNTINDKEVSISFNVTASNLGTKDTSYYTNRGGENAIYNLTETGQVEDGKYILVGYIPSGEDGVNGSIDITAYIDASNVAISDTLENGPIVETGYVNGTTSDWVLGREVFTTTEWNSFNSSNPLSFKVRVEANEGIWVEQEQFLVMKDFSYPLDSNWANIRANITSIEFHKDGEVPSNVITSFDVTDITSSGPVTLYTVSDGLENNTYKAIVVANDVIYAPKDSTALFYSMSKLVEFNSKNFRVDNVINMQGMFQNCTNLKNINGLGNWNTSNVSNMYKMFYICTNLSDVSGLANWNTGKVTDMSAMFQDCTNLRDISGLANWNVSNVTTMYAMFGSCTNLANVDGLANWNVSNVTIMSNMFFHVNIESYQPFANWNVSKVSYFGSMFNQTSASTITTLEGLENWDVSSATNMYAMFQDNVSLTDASAINNWNINASIDFTQMFYHDTVHPEFTKVSGTWNNGTFTPNA